MYIRVNGQSSNAYYYKLASTETLSNTWSISTYNNNDTVYNCGTLDIAFIKITGNSPYINAHLLCSSYRSPFKLFDSMGTTQISDLTSIDFVDSYSFTAGSTFTVYGVKK